MPGYFLQICLQIPIESTTFAPQSEKDAQMAESVDALVSNTSGFTSIPVRPRVWVLNRRAKCSEQTLGSCCLFSLSAPTAAEK